MRKFEKTASDKYVEKILKQRAKFDKKFPPFLERNRVADIKYAPITVEETSEPFTKEKFDETVRYQGNQDYRIFLNFQEWLSKITYKPNWEFEAIYQSDFGYSWIELRIDTHVEVPPPEIRLHFGTAQRIPIESSLLVLKGEKFNEKFLRTLIESEIVKVEFAIRDSWLKFDDIRVL